MVADLTPVVMPEAPPPELVSQSKDLDVMPDSDEDANDACLAEVPEELNKIIDDDGVGLAADFGNGLKFSAERDSLELIAIDCGHAADRGLTTDLCDGVKHGGHMEISDCVAATGGNGGTTTDELGPPICQRCGSTCFLPSTENCDWCARLLCWGCTRRCEQCYNTVCFSMFGGSCPCRCERNEITRRCSPWTSPAGILGLFRMESENVCDGLASGMKEYTVASGDSATGAGVTDGSRKWNGCDKVKVIADFCGRCGEYFVHDWDAQGPCLECGVQLCFDCTWTCTYCSMPACPLHIPHSFC